MIIDCQTCVVRGDACSDCVVTVLLGSPPALDSEEQQALAVLSDSGLVPPLRLVAPSEGEQAVAGGGDVTDDTPGRSTHAV